MRPALVTAMGPEPSAARAGAALRAATTAPPVLIRFRRSMPPLSFVLLERFTDALPGCTRLSGPLVGPHLFCGLRRQRGLGPRQRRNCSDRTMLAYRHWWMSLL